MLLWKKGTSSLTAGCSSAVCLITRDHRLSSVDIMQCHNIGHMHTDIHTNIHIYLHTYIQTYIWHCCFCTIESLAAEVHSCNVRTTVLQFKWPEHSAFMSIEENICRFKWRNMILFLRSFVCFSFFGAYGNIPSIFQCSVHPVKPPVKSLKALKIFCHTNMTYLCVLDFTCRHVFFLFFYFYYCCLVSKCGMLAWGSGLHYYSLSCPYKDKYHVWFVRSWWILALQLNACLCWAFNICIVGIKL